MYIFFGQIGLSKLTEQEKQDFIAYLNEELKKENAGSVLPVSRGQLRNKSIDPWTAVTTALDIIEVLTYVRAGAKAAKKLPYFYKKALEWLKINNKDTSHMDEVKKVLDFEKPNPKSQGDKNESKRSI